LTPSVGVLFLQPNKLSENTLHDLIMSIINIAYRYHRLWIINDVSAGDLCHPQTRSIWNKFTLTCLKFCHNKHTMFDHRELIRILWSTSFEDTARLLKRLYQLAIVQDNIYVDDTYNTGVCMDVQLSLPWYATLLDPYENTVWYSIVDHVYILTHSYA
jgi:hypothetical protein